MTSPDHEAAKALAEQAARKLVTVVLPENGWWGVRINNCTYLHQSEESAVIEREKWVEWLTAALTAARQALVERLSRGMYLRHHPTCQVVDRPMANCTCGLSGVFNELRIQRASPERPGGK